MKIPIDKIDYGIRRCLQSSRRINKIAKSVLNDYEPFGQIEIKQHDSTYAIVLFYYALEELGKAIRLEELKKGKPMQGSIEVEETLFKNHDYKIEFAKKRHPDLIIPELKRKIIKENTFQLLPSGKEIIGDFRERSNLWLVGYDEKSGKWKLGLEDIDDEDVMKKINDLDKILDEWMKKYGKLTQKPKPFDDGS